MRPKNVEKEAAIRHIAMEIIATEGLENLSMQKLAAAANISPRTIYIKYKDKDDLLIRLFIEEVLEAYEKAVLENFSEDMPFADGVQTLWLSAFHYFRQNKPAFALYRYGQSSPLLNKAYQLYQIKEGQFFAPVLRFLKANVARGIIPKFPPAVYRALLFAPIFELINEYFDHLDRPKQLVTPKLVLSCCATVIRGMQLQSSSN